MLCSSVGPMCILPSLVPTSLLYLLIHPASPRSSPPPHEPTSWTQFRVHAICMLGKRLRLWNKVRKLLKIYQVPFTFCLSSLLFEVPFKIFQATWMRWPANVGECERRANGSGKTKSNQRPNGLSVCCAVRICFIMLSIWISCTRSTSSVCCRP